MRRYVNLLTTFILALALSLSLVMYVNNAPEAEAQNPTRFRSVLVEHDLDVDGNFDLAGSFDVSNDLDINGNKLDLDADADTSITADTDDQIDFEIGGADVINFNALGISTSNITTTARASAGTFLNLAAQTALSITNGWGITPTGTYQKIQSGVPVTTSATTPIVAGSSGDLLILQNVNAADAIIVDGTGGTVECGANVTIDAGDTLSLIYDGSNWVCIAPLGDNTP